MSIKISNNQTPENPQKLRGFASKYEEIQMDFINQMKSLRDYVRDKLENNPDLYYLIRKQAGCEVYKRVAHFEHLNSELEKYFDIIPNNDDLGIDCMKLMIDDMFQPVFDMRYVLN